MSITGPRLAGQELAQARIERKLLVVERKHEKRFDTTHSHVTTADGKEWSLTGDRRYQMAKRLDFEVQAAPLERDGGLWIPRKLNTMMMIVEQALFQSCLSELSSQESVAREERVLRALDTRAELVPAMDSLNRLEGAQAVREFIVTLDQELSTG